MPYKISDIRQAALDVLKTEGSAMKTAIDKGTIDFYHGEAQDIVQLVPQMTIAFPACLVCYGGSTFTGFTGSWQDNFTLLIVYIAKDARGKLYLQEKMDALIEAGKTQLTGNNLGLDINPLIPGPIRMQTIQREFSVYSHQFTTFFTV